MRTIFGFKQLILICTVALLAVQCSRNSSTSIPHLQKQGTATQLIVDGKPYLILGAELLNSSSSGLKYMDTLWPKLAKMNLNTVLGGVSWDLIEPAEGKFDFTTVDAMIQNAQRYHLKLVVLWFGSWKNGMSHYVPEWVKKDTARFPRIKIFNDKKLEVLSAFSKNNVQADADAFAALMKHIREVDGKKHTVIMVQVENEVGIIGDSRDRSRAATNAYMDMIPKAFTDYLHKNKANLLPELRQLIGDKAEKTVGNWEVVFGSSPATDELFMAWNYAQYVNKVAEAGKKEYPLPMYVNAWIVQPQDKKPGDFPCGGPQAHNHDVWRAGAPNIDLLAPDIYLPDFTAITQQYARSGNQLFIPESFAGTVGAANAFYAIGQLNSIGYSPFGIETREPSTGKGPMAKAYSVLKQLAPAILDAQGKSIMSSVMVNKTDSVKNIQLGNYTLQISLRRDARAKENPESGYGLFINTGFDEYLIAGTDIEVSFSTTKPGAPTVGLASVFEGTFENGKWIPGRELNGDEIMKNYDFASESSKNRTGTVARLTGPDPGILKVILYTY